VSAARPTDGRFFDRETVWPGVKLLLGVGGRTESARALDRTLSRTRETGDDLTVAVFDDGDAASLDDVEARVRDALVSHGVDGEVRRVERDAGSGLVGLAEREGFDRIVLGGGERSPMGKVQVGAVAQYVVVNAPVTVTLVR
jgi:nucleotide-binding universal stress UspA family protein